MPQVSIRDQIKKLVELQKLDKEIFDYKKELENRPALLNELKESFEAKKAALKQLEEKAKAIQLDRKAKELDLKAKEDEITKANLQLSQLKTNKEYTAKLTEIETLKANKSVFEEKILVSYDESDVINAKIEKEKIFLAQEEKSYLTQKEEIEDTIKIFQDKVKILQSQRDRKSPEVDKEILVKYEKILEKRNGIALVPVQNEICGGCYMNITTQSVNEIKMHEKLIICEMCARILYLEDDL